MTSPPESDPSASARTPPTKGRALVPREHLYDGPVPIVIESVSVANRRRNRSGMITAFFGLLLFGAASFWLFTPRGGSSATADPTASAGVSSAGATDTPSASASASASATAPGATTGPAGPPSGVAMPTGDIPGWHQTLAEDFN